MAPILGEMFELIEHKEQLPSLNNTLALMSIGSKPFDPNSLHLDCGLPIVAPWLTRLMDGTVEGLRRFGTSPARLVGSWDSQRWFDQQVESIKVVLT
jgi:hypothetical protein